VSDLHLLTLGDGVSQGVAAVLLLMSVASWVVILRKSWMLRRAVIDLPLCVAAIWQSETISVAHERLCALDRDDNVRPLVLAAQLTTSGGLAGAGGAQQQLTRQLRGALHVIVRRLQWGQVVLATVGSVAPFVGLLGTVWGIFHALTALSGIRSLSLDQVASPVGESLVMTAAGLAVAIPAVLTYNVMGRLIARIEADLEGLALDLRELLGRAP
jgi:biopolymer transport protein ExbB